MNTEPIPISDILIIPWPKVRPLDIPLNTGGVEDVWNTIIKPMSDKEVVQSVETRCLMAIVRSVYWGMHGNTHYEEN
jgi:hypothetical protein